MSTPAGRDPAAQTGQADGHRRTRCSAQVRAPRPSGPSGTAPTARRPPGRVARLIARDRPTRFIYLGDVYPLGRPAAFRNGYDTVYGRATPAHPADSRQP